MSVKKIKITSTLQRIFLFAGVVFAGFFAVISAKWCFGHAISLRAEQIEIAEVGTSLAPDDPQTHYVKAFLLEKGFLPEEVEKSISEYEKAAALSPNDFLLWLALGKARERNGDTQGAEKAFLRAVELAPNYADSRWMLGNCLLRQGKFEEGFKEIRASASSSEKYVLPAISTAWTITNGDTDQIRKNLGDSTKLNAFLSIFLMKQNRFDDAFNTWNTLSGDEKSTVYKAQTQELYNLLFNAGKIRYAKIIRSAIDGNQSTDVFGKITSGGFDSNIKQDKPDFFDWQTGAGEKPLIGYDNKIKHSGNMSLVFIFSSPNGQDFRTYSQIVAVEGGKTYQFKGYYKSELKTDATLFWEIVNSLDNSVIAATDAVAANADWTGFESSFTVPQNVEAVVIRLARAKCSSVVCPINGKVWFDDFSIN